MAEGFWRQGFCAVWLLGVGRYSYVYVNLPRGSKDSYIKAVGPKDHTI